MPSTQQKMMGREVPGDQRVTITIRDWNAMKRAVWLSRQGWEIAARQAQELIDGCRHAEGCPGAEDDEAPCSGTPAYFESESAEEGKVNVGLTVQADACPDRELRMSALVILNAAKQFAPIDARKPAEAPYFAPSREYYSALLAELAIAQAQIEELRNDGKELPPPNLKEAT